MPKQSFDVDLTGTNNRKKIEGRENMGRGLLFFLGGSILLVIRDFVHGLRPPPYHYTVGIMDTGWGGRLADYLTNFPGTYYLVTGMSYLLLLVGVSLVIGGIGFLIWGKFQDWASR